MVEKIYDPDTARIFGLFEGQATLMLHSGSRGLGYQVCDDFLAYMTKNSKKLGFELPDRQLACSMIQSDAGIRYFNAMACAANLRLGKQTGSHAQSPGSVSKSYWNRSAKPWHEPRL